MAEKPAKKHPSPRYHRFFWQTLVPMDMALSLAFAALLVLTGVVVLVAVLLGLFE